MMNKLTIPILLIAVLGSFAQQQTNNSTVVTPIVPVPVVQNNNCNSLERISNCKLCVLANCTFIQEEFSSRCANSSGEYDQFTIWVAHNVSECQDTPTTTVPPTNTTTSTKPTIPTTTTPTPANTTTTTPTTTIPTTTLPSNTTTTLAPTNTTTTSTPATTTAPATNVTTPTTATPSSTPKPAPAGGFSWGSFFSGIIFTAGIGSVAYVVWRFYKVRTERNYHTL